jgi:hypothetical protein
MAGYGLHYQDSISGGDISLFSVVHSEGHLEPYSVGIRPLSLGVNRAKCESDL